MMSDSELECFSEVLPNLFTGAPWELNWENKQFTLMGPVIEQILGWPSQSWVDVYSWAERIHPDEREQVVDFCTSQSLFGIDHEATFRALADDGSYRWIRDIVHVNRRDGETEKLMGFIFDVTEEPDVKFELKVLKKYADFEFDDLLCE
ncbi:PAS domain-containing protein [Vibrio sp. WXL103]|uniref:PAS domain-containing protein n=1 Tax=unclassified Vibrio TaxID=2614977 RepID=UPI003EC7FE48